MRKNLFAKEKMMFLLKTDKVTSLSWHLHKTRRRSHTGLEEMVDVNIYKSIWGYIWPFLSSKESQKSGGKCAAISRFIIYLRLVYTWPWERGTLIFFERFQTHQVCNIPTCTDISNLTSHLQHAHFSLSKWNENPRYFFLYLKNFMFIIRRWGGGIN